MPRHKDVVVVVAVVVVVVDDFGSKEKGTKNTSSVSCCGYTRLRTYFFSQSKHFSSFVILRQK